MFQKVLAVFVVSTLWGCASGVSSVSLDIEPMDFRNQAVKDHGDKCENELVQGMGYASLKREGGSRETLLARAGSDVVQLEIVNDLYSDPQVSERLYAFFGFDNCSISKALKQSTLQLDDLRNEMILCERKFAGMRDVHRCMDEAMVSKFLSRPSNL